LAQVETQYHGFAEIFGVPKGFRGVPNLKVAPRVTSTFGPLDLGRRIYYITKKLHFK